MSIPNTNSSTLDKPNRRNLSWEQRRQAEKMVAFCFDQLFYFEPELVAEEGDYASSQERDAAPKPAPLSREVLPPLRLDAELLPETILVPAADGSIWGDLHPLIALPVNVANGYKELSYELRLILSYRYGFKRSPEEIAEILGYARATVYNCLNRAIEILARYLLEAEMGTEVETGLRVALVSEAPSQTRLPQAAPVVRQRNRHKKLGKFFYLKNQVHFQAQL